MPLFSDVVHDFGGGGGSGGMFVFAPLFAGLAFLINSNKNREKSFVFSRLSSGSALEIVFIELFNGLTLQVL